MKLPFCTSRAPECQQVHMVSPIMKLGFPGGSVSKESPAMQETWVWPLGWKHPLEESMATHSSILAWRIPMDRRSWRAVIHGVAKTRKWQSNSALHSVRSQKPHCLWDCLVILGAWFWALPQIWVGAQESAFLMVHWYSGKDPGLGNRTSRFEEPSCVVQPSCMTLGRSLYVSWSQLCYLHTEISRRWSLRSLPPLYFYGLWDIFSLSTRIQRSPKLKFQTCKGFTLVGEIQGHEMEQYHMEYNTIWW